MQSATLPIVSVVCGAALLAGCSSTALPRATSSTTASSSSQRLGSFKELAVVYDDDGEVLAVLNDKFKKVMSIPDSGAYTDWVDAAGKFYSANALSQDVDEFDKTGKLLYKYSTDLTQPNDVTTDPKGDVVVANGLPSESNAIVEFPQGSNKPSITCSTGLSNYGVAFDNSGNLFVAGNKYGEGVIQEYKGGLSGCSATTLTVTVSFPVGVQVDKTGDLVVCDVSSGVDIIPPPYKSITKTIKNKGQKDYNYDALDQESQTLFTSDEGGSKVFVNAYPSGTLEKTLDMRNVSGVATYPFQK